MVKNFKSMGKMMWEYANGIDYSEVEKANREKINAWLEKKNSEVK